MNALLVMLAEKYPILGFVFLGLGALVILGQVYVSITPNQKDDAWFAKLESVMLVGSLLRALKSFAPIQRKEIDKK